MSEVIRSFSLLFHSQEAKLFLNVGLCFLQQAFVKGSILYPCLILLIIVRQKTIPMLLSRRDISGYTHGFTAKVLTCTRSSLLKSQLQWMGDLQVQRQGGGVGSGQPPRDGESVILYGCGHCRVSTQVGGSQPWAYE